MNFDKLANTVLENVNATVSEETEARKPNPDFQSWKASQDPAFIAGLKNPYTHWYLKVKGKNPEMVAPQTHSVDVGPGTENIADEVPDSGSSDPEALKTRAAIEDFLNTNPEASVSDVVQHLKGLNDQGIGLRTSYITHAPEIEEMLADIKNQQAADVSSSDDVEPLANDLPEPELSSIDAERTAKFDKLRKFMALKRADRDKFLAARSQSHLDGNETDTDVDDEEEPGPDIDPLAKKLANMYKDPEEDPEFGDDNNND